MTYLPWFFSGLFCANGIPHFVNGISGKDFHTPFFYRRFVKRIPSPLFNTIWGLLNFLLALYLAPVKGWPEFGSEAGWAWGAGFAFAALGLALLFERRYKKGR